MGVSVENKGNGTTKERIMAKQTYFFLPFIFCFAASSFTNCSSILAELLPCFSASCFSKSITSADSVNDVFILGIWYNCGINAVSLHKDNQSKSINMNTKVYDIDLSSWFTPNTYDSNYRYPTEKSGVYLIIDPHIFELPNPPYDEILYVGSTTNILKRYNSHEVLRKIKKERRYVQFYFKEVENFLEEEYRLIHIIQPPFNKQGKLRHV